MTPMVDDLTKEIVSLGIGIQEHIIRDAYEIRTCFLKSPIRTTLMADIHHMGIDNTLYGSYCRILNDGNIGLYRLAISCRNNRIDIHLIRPYDMDTRSIWTSALIGKDSLIGILVKGFEGQWFIKAYLRKAKNGSFFFEFL